MRTRATRTCIMMYMYSPPGRACQALQSAPANDNYVIQAD
jgi:hypothetical protein